MNDFTPELRTALEAVERAEQVPLKYFGHNPRVQIKADMSPVTQADIEAEGVIVETIRAHFPTHSILGEESGITQHDSDFMWIIDPIDGTKNYMRGIPLFGIEVALCHKGEPIVGVSSVPALGERLFAEKGHGAFLNSPERQVHVNDVALLQDAYVNFGGLNGFTRDNEEGNMLRIVRASGRVRATGDAYAYHLLATGRCDAVIEARISFWDIAALSVIVHEAGGSCTDLKGNALTVDTKSALFTNGRIHDALLDLYWNSEVPS